MDKKEETDLNVRGKAFLLDVGGLEEKYEVKLIATITKYGPRMQVINKSVDKKDDSNTA